MTIQFTLNHKKVSAEISPDTVLYDLVRSLGCASVKCGCETSNCGLCTVFLDDVPVLSCSVLAARVDGRCVTTLEGLQQEAAEFGAFIADQGAEQCVDGVGLRQRIAFFLHRVKGLQGLHQGFGFAAGAKLNGARQNLVEF